jgi:hypothetical protein
MKRHAREGDDELVMLDGRRFFTHDNWQTVFLDSDGKVRRVTGEAANRIRYLAVAQSSAGP